MSELNSYSYRETSDILILVNRSYVDAFNFYISRYIKRYEPKRLYFYNQV